MLKTAWIATTNALFRKTGPSLLKYPKIYIQHSFSCFILKGKYTIYMLKKYLPPTLKMAYINFPSPFSRPLGQLAYLSLSVAGSFLYILLLARSGMGPLNP